MGQSARQPMMPAFGHRMIAPRDSVPHFEVTAIDGRRVRYAGIWQRRNLVLVTLPPSSVGAAGGYAAELTRAVQDVAGGDAECVVTADDVPGVTAPAVTVADRWGEVCYTAVADTVASLPSAGEVADWVQYVRTRCPECEGEAK